MRVSFLLAHDGARSTQIVGEKLVEALALEGVEIDSDGAQPDVVVQYPLFGWLSPQWQELLDQAPARVCMGRIESGAVEYRVAALYNKFDQCWFPSLASCAAALRSGVEARKVWYVPYGVDPVVPAPGVLLEREPGGVVFLANCQNGHEHRKGVDLVLEAFARVLRARPNARLAWLTDRQGRVETQAAQHEIPASALQFIRPVLLPEQLASLYAQADACVFPVRGGSFELMPLEAIAAGGLVLVPDNGPCDYAAPAAVRLPTLPIRPLFPVESRWARGLGEVGDGNVVLLDALAEAMLDVAAGRIARPSAAVVEATRQQWSWRQSARRAIAALAALEVEEVRAETVAVPGSVGDMARRAAGKAAAQAVAQPAAAAAPVPAPVPVSAPAPTSKQFRAVAALLSPHERCGIGEYGKALNHELGLLGLDVLEATLADLRGLTHLAPGSVVLAHYEPALVSEAAKDAIRAARARGVRVALVCHWFGAERILELDGLADRIVVHRDYDVVERLHETIRAKIVQIPLGCQEYAPGGSRPELRAKYGLPADKTIITTAGFLTAWKQLPQQVSALLERKGGANWHLQLLCARHFLDAKSVEEALRGAVGTRDDVTLSCEFLPRTEVLDRIAASDVGFLYHGRDTGSASAAANQFVSARCPLVVTDSTHDSGILRGVFRTEKNLPKFAAAVVDLGNDFDRQGLLRAEMQAEFARLRMSVVARQYKTLIEELEQAR